MERNYDGIDLMKFIGAIFIVGINSSAFSDVNPMINDVLFQGIGRLAFPLFFVASGFFLSKKIQKDKTQTNEIVASYTKRIGLIFIFWLLFNWKWVWESWFSNTTGVFDESNIFKFLVDIVTQSTYSGSWYLAACIIAAVLYFVVFKKFAVWFKTFLAALIFLAVATFTMKVNNQIVFYIKDVLAPPVTLLMGPIYFAVGDIIARDKVDSIRSNRGVYWLGLVASLMLWGVELYMKRGFLISTDQLFIYPIICYFIFCLLLTIKVDIPYAFEMRKISSVMYLTQFSFMFLNQSFLNVTGTVNFSLVFFESLALGVVLLRLRKLNEFKWLDLAY